jgi:hypothetical protein
LHAATEVEEKFNQGLEGWNSLNGFYSLWKSCLRVCQGGFGCSGHDVIYVSSRELLRELNMIHQKQHYVPYYLSIVLILSLKYAFWDHKYVFHLGKVFYHLVDVTFNLLHPCFLPYIHIYHISVRLLMSHEKYPIRQVLYIIKFGTFAFFFIWYRILFKFIMFNSKCPKCHTHFFVFCLILLVSTV